MTPCIDTTSHMPESKSQRFSVSGESHALRSKPVLWVTCITFVVAGCADKVTDVPVNPSTTNPQGYQSVLVEEMPSMDPLLLPDVFLKEGWLSLFDGQTLFGWETTGDVDWHVQRHSIVADNGRIGFLYTTMQFSDYTMYLEYRGTPATNSGVFLHMPPEPKDPNQDCYEVNIAPPDNAFPTASLVGRKKITVANARNDWNTFEITVRENTIAVRLNEQSVLEYTDEMPLGRGHIGLQHNQGKIEFRNIRIKPLRTESIFNGKDLAGWRIKPGLASTFSVTPDGHLNIKNGKGQIETENVYGDFVLQFECMTLGEELNSGVFFRCIPRDLWMGYESQIHNGFIDGDRRKPNMCGTGGIFRRQNARRIVANDNEWFHKTIIADRNHMAVWVNGYQVSDWTDERDPNDNPRKGMRTEPGTIILQGHDPSTNLLFRNFRIAEIRPRRAVSAVNQ